MPARTPPLAVRTSTTSITPATRPRRQYTRLARGSFDASIYAGKIVAVQLQTAEDHHVTIRVLDKRLFPNHDALFEYSVTVSEDDGIHFQQKVPTLPFSTNAFDRWHSSVCFGNARIFSRREFLCQEIGDGEYLLRDNGKPWEEVTTLGLMTETYSILQTIGTVSASKMILREIGRKVKGMPVGTLLDAEEDALLKLLNIDDPIFAIVSDFIPSSVVADSRSA